MRESRDQQYTSSQTLERLLNEAIIHADISNSFEEYVEIFDTFYADDIEVSSDVTEEPVRGKSRVRSLLFNFLVQLLLARDSCLVAQPDTTSKAPHLSSYSSLQLLVLCIEVRQWWIVRLIFTCETCVISIHLCLLLHKALYQRITNYRR